MLEKRQERVYLLAGPSEIDGTTQVSMQLVRRIQHGDGCECPQLTPFRIDALTRENLPVRVRDDELLHRRMQRPEVGEQLLVGPAVNLLRRPHAPLLPLVVLGVVQGLPAGIRHLRHRLAPYAESREREGIAHIEEALQQELLDPPRRNPGTPRRRESLPQE